MLKKGRKLWKSVKNICIIEIKALSLRKNFLKIRKDFRNVSLNLDKIY